MGQATILSHLGGGLYRVKLLFDNGIVTARIAVIELQITALDAQIADLETQKNAAYADLQTALDAMNAYLGSVTPEQLATDPTAINALTKAAFTARAHYDTLAMRWRMAKSKRTALETNRSYLQNYCPSDITVDAWSMSFNEDLTGNVATIEVDYVLQRNSGTGQAVVNDSGVWLFPGAQFDSKLQHPLASSEHATWFNLCMLPAMQRDRPRYRVATISNLDKINSTCTVTFDGASSFVGNGLAPAHPIFPYASPSNGAVIAYPPCNGEAFENGDRVIVASGWLVIGFYSNPRECKQPPVFTVEEVLPGSAINTTLVLEAAYKYASSVYDIFHLDIVTGYVNEIKSDLQVFINGTEITVETRDNEYFVGFFYQKFTTQSGHIHFQFAKSIQKGTIFTPYYLFNKCFIDWSFIDWTLVDHNFSIKMKWKGDFIFDADFLITFIPDLGFHWDIQNNLKNASLLPNTMDATYIDIS